MLSEVIDTDSPILEGYATETTSGFDVRGCDPPRVHRPAEVLRVVNKFQMLAEVILSVECTFVKLALLA